jgi:ABC-type cobalamin/Fe3+-siderophores transport system ATPase subunit
MATHFPNHALLTSTNVLLMKEGGFIAQGSPQTVITRNHLKTLYGIDVQIVLVENGTGQQEHVIVPLMNEPRTP